MVFETVQYFEFELSDRPNEVVFLSDLADRCHLNDAEFERNLPPRHDAPGFRAWCADRGLNPVADESETELWGVTVSDPALRFEFKMRWGL